MVKVYVSLAPVSTLGVVPDSAALVLSIPAPGIRKRFTLVLPSVISLDTVAELGCAPKPTTVLFDPVVRLDPA